MLYKLTTDYGKSKSYLLGTMHLDLPDLQPQIDRAKLFIDKTSAFYGEMNILEVTSQLSEAFNLPSDQQLNRLINPKKYAKITKQLDRYFGLKIEDVCHLRPMFINALLTERRIKSGQDSMDHQLFQYALSKGLTIGGLESMEDQIKIAQSIPLDFQIKQLIDSLNNISKFTKRNQELVKDFVSGNTVQVFKKSKRHMGATKHIMLYDRNQNLANAILSKMTDEPNRSIFFCFGAAHLSGNKGVMAYLMRSGVKVVDERI
jgi:uncharacterized protein